MTTRSKNETPEERFKRVAEARTNSVMDKLRLLGNCANARIYSYNQEDVNKIFTVINKQVKEVRAKFIFKKQEEFKL